MTESEINQRAKENEWKNKITGGRVTKTKWKDKKRTLKETKKLRTTKKWKRKIEWKIKKGNN